MSVGKGLSIRGLVFCALFFFSGFTVAKLLNSNDQDMAIPSLYHGYHPHHKMLSKATRRSQQQLANAVIIDQKKRCIVKDDIQIVKANDDHLLISATPFSFQQYKNKGILLASETHQVPMDHCSDRTTIHYGMEPNGR